MMKWLLALVAVLVMDQITWVYTPLGVNLLTRLKPISNQPKLTDEELWTLKVWAHEWMAQQEPQRWTTPQSPNRKPLPSDFMQAVDALVHKRRPMQYIIRDAPIRYYNMHGDIHIQLC